MISSFKKIHFSLHLFLTLSSSLLVGDGVGCKRDYHGVNVDDPYAWLENSEDEQTISWLQRQSLQFDSYIHTCAQRTSIREKLFKMTQYDHFQVPQRVGKNYYFLKRQPDQEHFVLFVQEGTNAVPRQLFDPQLEQIEQNDDITAIADFSPSPDGNHVAVGLMTNGSDWIVWKVKDVPTAQFTEDLVVETKFWNVTWAPDSKGFYYTKSTIDDRQSVYYHSLKSSQAEDVLIFEDKEHPELLFVSSVTNDGCYLLIQSYIGCDITNGLWIKELKKNDPCKKLVSPGKATYNYIHNEQSKFFFLTNEDAPLSKVITTDIHTNFLESSEIFIPEAESPLESVTLVGNKFAAAYLEDTYGALKIFDGQGSWLHDVTLPQKGTIYAQYSHQFLVGSLDSEELLFGFTNFVQPTQIYSYNTETKHLQIFKDVNTPFLASDYRIQQIFYRSKDGTMVPMSLVSKKDLPINNETPTLLYGYGGFGISILPEFDAAQFAWVERGGLLAIVNIRGGSEYGEKWHSDGAYFNKQNSFDDFIAAAEWLTTNGFTNSSKLAIQGRSNGGLLVAACMIQRPELFGAVSVEVGVLDMLRFHLFTIGWSWMTEFGNPEKPEDFDTLYKYSPYHNLCKGTHYPATLVSTAAYDDRVVPLHSYKFAAALQSATASARPVLLRVDTQAGHGGGRSVSQVIEETVDIHAFFLKELR